jgi:hypothetical protein
MNIALLSDEILMRHLYAILCTMFHRYELHRVEFLYKLILQIEVHSILSFTETQSLYHRFLALSNFGLLKSFHLFCIQVLLRRGRCSLGSTPLPFYKKAYSLFTNMAFNFHFIPLPVSRRIEASPSLCWI